MKCRITINIATDVHNARLLGRQQNSRRRLYEGSVLFYRTTDLPDAERLPVKYQGSGLLAKLEILTRIFLF